MIQYYIEIAGDFKSKELYDRICPFDGNVIDTGERVWAHGKATPAAFIQVMITCLEFGKLKIDVYKL